MILQGKNRVDGQRTAFVGIVNFELRREEMGAGRTGSGLGFFAGFACRSGYNLRQTVKSADKKDWMLIKSHSLERGNAK